MKATGLTPEERAAELSRINALNGTIGAAKRWQKERKEALHSLANQLSTANDSPSTAIERHDSPRVATESPVLGLGVRGKVLEVSSNTSDVGSSVSDDNSKSLKPSNRKTGKPKSCRPCAQTLSRAKSHTCDGAPPQTPQGTSRPLDPTADIFAAQAPQSAASPHLTVCPICEAPDLPYFLYDKHVAQCKAKQAARAATIQR